MNGDKIDNYKLLVRVKFELMNNICLALRTKE